MVDIQVATPPVRVLIAWELGGGLGHVTKGLLLAQRLLEAGCEVSFAVRDLAATHPLLPDASYRLYQAPVVWAKLSALHEPADFAELLLHAGFGHSSSLQGLVRGWLTLFEADGAQVVVADHAPSALLAARCAGLPAITFGLGFFVPPAPWPVFRHWEATPADRLARTHAHVLGCINACLTAFQAAPVQRLDELMQVARHFLCTEPGLDHYAGRHDERAHYLGTLWVDRVGAPVAWPDDQGTPMRRVFAYLRPGLPGLDAVLEALSLSDAAVIVASPGIAPNVTARWRSARLVFATDLVQLRGVADSADLVVCSGSDTLHGMALEGVPVLGLPMSAEQRIAAERVQALGAGRWCLPGSSAQELLAAVNALLDDPRYRTAARALRAQSPSRHELHSRLQPVVNACIELATATT